jgi:dipeptidyl aminopeptidase/acylaminoacyl peptidase
MKVFLGSIFIILFMTLDGCKGNITGTDQGRADQICYVKENNGNWDVFTNDVSGGSRTQITTFEDADEYPQWSPDGNYIVFSRHVKVNAPLCIVYDIKTKTETNLTPDGSACQMPQWLPNGKVCLNYPYAISPHHETYILNSKGTDRKMILDSAETATMKLIFFYADSYNFVYVLNWSEVYKTNIDRTKNEYIGDLTQMLGQPIVVQGFNALSEELLFTFNIDGKNAIGTYNIVSKVTTTRFTTETGYLFAQVAYSNDYGKIGIIEQGKTDEYLSVLENGVKRRLFRLTEQTPSVSFGFEPIKFSTDGRYIIYTKQIAIPGNWVHWNDELHVVDVVTGKDSYIDDGHSPSWNPRP